MLCDAKILMTSIEIYKNASNIEWECVCVSVVWCARKAHNLVKWKVIFHIGRYLRPIDAEGREKNVEEMFSVLHYFPFFLSFQKYIRHKPAKLLCVCVRGVFVVRTEKKNFRFREEQTNLWWFWIDNECESESDRKGKFFPVFLQTCRRADDVVQSVKRTFAIITKWNWRKT